MYCVWRPSLVKHAAQGGLSAVGKQGVGEACVAQQLWCNWDAPRAATHRLCHFSEGLVLWQCCSAMQEGLEFSFCPWRWLPLTLVGADVVVVAQRHVTRCVALQLWCNWDAPL
jgi:hypothetical protein